MIYILLLIPIIFRMVFNNLFNNKIVLAIYYIFIFINTILIIKLIIDYFKHDKKKMKVIDYNEIIDSLSKLNIYQKFINCKNILIVINESGIYEFVYLNIEGILKGNINDDYWIINNEKIKNPFIKYKNMNYYYVLNKNLQFNIKGVWLTTSRTIVETIEKKLSKKQFNRKEIDRIYNDLSNNVKKIDYACKK